MSQPQVVSWARPLFGASALGLLSVVVIACPKAPSATSTSTGEVSQTQDADGGYNPFPPPPDKITKALAQMPPDFSGTPAQSNFDLYAWREFIALNWPADPATCGPDTNQSILGGGGPRVWETYLTDAEVFVAQGQQPAAWCKTPGTSAVRLARLPAVAQALAQKTGVTRFMVHTAKARHSHLPRLAAGLSATDPTALDQAVGGVLVDQNGRFVRYEVRLNQDEYNYLDDNNLWNLAGQKGVTINLPNGPNDHTCKGQSCGPVGAIEVKAAWKVLGPGDDPSRFYTVQAIVFNDDLDPPTPSPGSNPVTLGLVGFHIAHKTKSQKSWQWATFEHVDNVTKSFNNPKCPQTPPHTPNVTGPCTSACCPPNTQTASKDPNTKTYEELDPTGKPLHRPAQITRVDSDQITSADLNAHFQKLLAGSVWANYQLISNQWQGNLSSIPKPAYLADTTLETFNQGPVPPTDGPVAWPNSGYQPFSTEVSSSCMKCHSVASNSNSQKTDFSFIVGNAQ